MVDVAQKQLIASISRDLIAQAAPQELPLFPAVSEAYFKNPNKMLKDQTGKDEMLGFGVEAVSAVMMSPIVLTIVSEVVKLITEEIQESGIIRKMFKKFGHAEDEAKPVSRPLTPELMEKMHQVAFEKACQYNLSQAKAEQLADSLVAKLAMTYT
jgi:hypothetical protein